MTRPYLLFGKQEHAEMTGRLAPALNAWTKLWFGSDPLSLVCTPATFDENLKCNWWYAKPAMGQGIYIQKAPGFTKELTRALFGDLPKTAGLGETPTPIIGDCFSELIMDLAYCTLQAITEAKDQPRPVLLAQTPVTEQTSVGSGAILAQLNCVGISISIVIPGMLAEATLRASASSKSAVASTRLADPLTLIRSKPISLTAVLGQAKIEIGTLQSIAIGDVIRFETKADQPATLLTEDGTALCQGYVGSRNHFKALQLHR